ncbi:TPA: DNA polymerase III subunit theta, partial [Morganella morganii]
EDLLKYNTLHRIFSRSHVPRCIKLPADTQACKMFRVPNSSQYPFPCYTPIITHHSETNMHNIANLTQDEKDKINADLAASGIAYKERLGLPYDLYETENQQPEHLRQYFRERLEHYREIGKRFPRGFEYEKE